MLCNTHYMRYLKHGDPGEGKIRLRRVVPQYIPKETL